MEQLVKALSNPFDHPTIVHKSREDEVFTYCIDVAGKSQNLAKGISAEENKRFGKGGGDSIHGNVDRWCINT